MKRLDFLRSLLAAPAIIKAAMSTKPSIEEIGEIDSPISELGNEFHNLVEGVPYVNPEGIVRCRLVGDMPMRTDALLDPEIFTSILDRHGEDRVIHFFGRSFDGKVSVPIDIEKQ